MFKNTKLGMKVIYSLGVILFFGILVGIAGYAGMKTMRGNIEEIGEVRLPSIEHLLMIRVGQNAAIIGESALVNRRFTDKKREEAYEFTESAWERIDTAWNAYLPLPMTAEEEVLWNKFTKIWEKWKDYHEKVIELSKDKDILISRGFDNSSTEILDIDSRIFEAHLNSKEEFEKSVKLLGELTDLNEKVADEEILTAENNGDTAITVLFGAIFAAVIFSVLMALGISKNINNIIKTMLSELNQLIQAVVNGKLDVRSNTEKINFEFRGVASGINEMIDAFVGPINVTAEYVDRISKGDIPPKITDEYRGDFNEIKLNLNQCIDVMNNLLEETNKLIKATQEGKLKTRGDYKKFQNGWSDLVKGVNNLIQAFVDPINVTSDYVNKISDGNIPPKITDEYKGDFNIIKMNLNQCIDAVNGLIKDADMLAEAAVEGRLSTRADVSQHKGDYAKIVQGVNNTIDAILEPVNESVDIIQRMANGDLTRRMTGHYKGDHAILKTALNNTLEALNEILDQVNIAVDQIKTGSQQVSDSSQSLSQGATEQASSIEEITSSMEQISSQTQNNAEQAREANNLSAHAKDEAENGNSQMNNLIQAMVEISEASKNINKIIKVIDEIAFQTNLLALNAAVEAARAGKHGKGFAVVAEEVRNLAARSAKAAGETAELIESTVQKIEKGSEISSNTAEALKEIVTGVTKVSDLVGEIAAASNEQAQGISQVNQGLNQIEQVTQQNTANAEESAAASEELSTQAIQLQQMVGKFQITSQGKLNAYHSVPQTKQINSPSQQRGNVKMLNPSDVIDLDDDEFGKY